MKALIIVASILVVLILIGWLGLQIKPRSFPPLSHQNADLETAPLPDGLPAPVERFYRQVYGDIVPVIDTIVITGRGTMRVNGITFPARFRFTHQAGEAYRHYIEATIYGFPLLKVNEHYIDGNSRLELPFGISEGTKVDQGANLALWAEAVWMPSVWVTDSRARWEPVDDNNALLYIPFKDGTEQFIMRFDPETGLLSLMESMRYKGEDSKEKTLWINQVLEWDISNEQPVPEVTAITWFDEGAPWAVLTTEDVVYNMDVNEYIQTKGP